MRKPGARAKLREYFLSNAGKILELDTLRSVAETSEWARCIRELRNEVGYKILTHNDRTNLKPGQYILEYPNPRPAFARSISKEVRAFVLDRNGFTCQLCGAVASEPHPYSPGRAARLHVGHIIDKSMGGSGDPSNLKAICSACNEGSSNWTLDRPSYEKLLIQMRRATAADQLKALEWLASKFPQKSDEITKKRS